MSHATVIDSRPGPDAAAVPLLRRQVDVRAFAACLAMICLVLCIPVGFALSPLAFRDGDVSWQIAAGRWMLTHGRIPTVDPFSFTVAGQPWVAMEWLSELAFGTAFDLDGYAGVASLVAAALIALDALVFFHLQRRVSLPVLAASMVLLDLVLAPFIVARPHLLAWPLLAAWTIVLLRAAEHGRPPRLAWTLLLAVWTNAHASFPLALPIAAAIGLDSAIENKWTNFRAWLVFGLASVAALTLNLNGVGGLLQPFKTASLAMLPLIGEWRPSSTLDTPAFFAALLLGFGAMAWAGVRVPLGRLLLLLTLLGLAFLHMRHQSTFIIVTVLVVAPLFRSAPMRCPVPKPLLLGCVPLLAYAGLSGFVPPESQSNPRQLIAAVPERLRGQPLFNDYNFGGSLILAGIKPYVDERAEIYGDSFVENYRQIAMGDMAAFNAADRRYRFASAMLGPKDAPLVHALERSGKWRRLYSDGLGVIEVRRALVSR